MMCARPECGHPRAIHTTDACRINGCRCAGFDDGKRRVTGPRRVAIDIPEGYVLSITLAPWDPGAGPEEAVSAVPAPITDAGPVTAENPDAGAEAGS